MDTTGAIIGAFMALLILIIFSTNPDVFRIAFLFSFIPAIFAVGLIFLLKEKPNLKSDLHTKKLKISLPREFKLFLLIIMTFAFVQVNTAFFIIRSRDIFNQLNPVWWPISGLLRAEIFAIFGFLIYNIVYAIFSTSLGGLSDKIGRIPVIIGGLSILSFVLFLFAIIPIIRIPELVFLGMILFGLYIASTEGILKAMVADITKGDSIKIRGRAYGWFNLTIGLVALFSAILFGLLWDILGSSETFFIYAILVIIPIIGFLILKNNISS